MTLKREITIRVRKGDDWESVPAFLYSNGEIPPSLNRGRNRHMKNRRYKQEKMERINDLRLLEREF